MFWQKTMVLAKRSVALRNFGDLGGDPGGALFEYERAIVVAVVVFAVFYGVTESVGLP